MAKKNGTRTIVVAGDVTMDWNIATTQTARGAASSWSPEISSSLFWQRGGAAQLADIMEAVSATLPEGEQYAVRQADVPCSGVFPFDRQYHHSLTMWAPFPYRTDALKEKKAWRVDRFLGLDRGKPDNASLVIPAAESPDRLVVLDDGGLDFRHQTPLWQPLLAPGKPDWILLKMAKPVAQGPLWDELLRKHAGRVVVITTVNDLRQTAIQVSRNISWERTAQDVCWELTYNPQVNSLSRCAAVIVSFYAAGAILLTRSSGNKLDATLFFDPFCMEGEWERRHPGQIVGYTSCLTAAVARQMMLAPQAPDLPRAIQSGVAAMRLLHADGFAARGGAINEINLRLPIAEVVKEIEKDAAPLSVAAIQDPARYLVAPPSATEPPPAQPAFWTILEDRQTQSLEVIARLIVEKGYDAALRQVPIGKFGYLVTVDRREIEALHSVQSLMTEYCRCDQSKPLSVAVFGPPGSGKSFGVKQVARSILGDKPTVLTFNLSQFNHPEELYAALHQVRDKCLTGEIPLVFWDEFDTPLNGQPLGWLRYLLAPMQDGAFQEGQLVHPIGRCIFVFAGGTSPSMAAFGADLGDEQKRAAKLPDFVSRLRGFLNVLGPNPQDGAGRDPFFILRRALLLRSLLEQGAPQIVHNKVVDIDPGILRAFLNTRIYRHGARSMESIIGMSTLADRSAFERSSLPSEEQLDLHVDAGDFLALVRQIELEGELLEKLAQAAHEVFCDGLKASGYRYGAETDEKKKTHSNLLPYDELPEEEKEQNRLNVRDIPAKLSAAGYRMRPARSHERPFNFPGTDLDTLSRLEHARWVTAKLNAGWQYAPQTDRERKEHASLVPWEQLSEGEKEKDRQLVRGIPQIVAKAGFAIERAG